MSDIQGIGPNQPIRPAKGLPPATPNRAASEADAPEGLGFGDDAISVSGKPPAEKPSRPSAGVPTSQDRTAPSRTAANPPVEEVDGFLVAGAGRSARGSSASDGAGGVTHPLGPIAVFDEPTAPTVGFPDLDLNGPANADRGIYSLSGQRLA